jgi:hypothetical protein
MQEGEEENKEFFNESVNEPEFLEDCSSTSSVLAI